MTGTHEGKKQPGLEDQLLLLSRFTEGLRARLQASGADSTLTTVEHLRELGEELRKLQGEAQEAESEKHQLTALVDIARVINSSLELPVVLNEVVDTIIRLTGAERCFLMLRDEAGDLEILAARNWEQISLDSSELEISNTVVQQVVESGTAVLTTNARTDPRFGGQSSIIAYNLRSILCVPLIVKDELTGVIYTDNRVREGLFTRKEHDLLSAFANQAAVALENARLFNSVRRMLAEVTELKNLMEDVLTSIDNAVITAGSGDVITLCNQAAEVILGRSRDELLGSSLPALLKEFSPTLPHTLQDVKQGDERITGLELHTYLENRGGVDLSLSMTPLKNASGDTEGVTLLLDDLTEKRRLEAQHQLFEKMVSPAVVRQLDPESLQLGGTRSVITTLFADIRGYTHFSETIDPESLMQVLNQYLAMATNAILAEGGTIDKFLGDAVMAWFNAPVMQEDHADRAVRAAVQIQSMLPDLHTKLPETFRMHFGIGIHSGEALLGLVGTQKRLEYTAVGDSVNTAKRLQETAAAGQILLSRATVDQLHRHGQLSDFRKLQLEGKVQPIEVCELLAYPAESSSA